MLDSNVLWSRNHVTLVMWGSSDECVQNEYSLDIKDDCDTEITTNGSLISTDDFATSIRKNTKASQALIIYGEDVCTYKIILN